VDDRPSVKSVEWDDKPRGMVKYGCV